MAFLLRALQPETPRDVFSAVAHQRKTPALADGWRRTRRRPRVLPARHPEQTLTLLVSAAPRPPLESSARAAGLTWIGVQLSCHREKPGSESHPTWARTPNFRRWESHQPAGLPLVGRGT